MADMQLTPAGATDLSCYPADQFHVLARPEDLAVSSPLVRVDIAVVRIDARDVRAGGETHNLGGGQLTPARSAVDKIGDAAGITFDETRCETRREGERVWVAKAVGRRRLPDGTWRTVAAEYELDVDVREQEIRTREQNESKVQREVLQLQKFGRQRADTGARLRVIRALAGIKTGFAPGELERPFVIARVSVNTEEMMGDPVMRQALVNQALGAASDVYGPREPRNVTPEPEQLPAGEQPEVDAEAPADEEIPFEDDIPWDEDATQIARRRLENVLADERYLPPGKREEMRALVARADATAEELDAFAERAESYWRKVATAREARS